MDKKSFVSLFLIVSSLFFTVFAESGVDYYEKALNYYEEASMQNNPARARPLYEEALKYAQWAFPRTEGRKREEMRIIITNVREKLQEIEHTKREARSKGKVIIGMSKREVIALWGEPSDINRTTVEGGVNEQWCYGNVLNRTDRYVYFNKDGIVTGVQD